MQSEADCCESYLFLKINSSGWVERGAGQQKNPETPVITLTSSHPSLLWLQAPLNCWFLKCTRDNVYLFLDVFQDCSDCLFFVSLTDARQGNKVCESIPYFIINTHLQLTRGATCTANQKSQKK